jgi:hypothetical protein
VVVPFLGNTAHPLEASLRSVLLKASR